METTALICTTVTWTSLYYGCVCFLKGRKPEFCCRLVTAVHACVATTLAVWHCFIAQTWEEGQPGGPNTKMEIITISNSLGYFLFDIAWCMYHQTEGYTMLAHHVVSITALSRVLMKGVSASEAITGIGGLEITNPLLQLRWFLRDAGYKGTFVFKVVEVVFMVFFFVMRVIGGGYLVSRVVFHPRPDFEIKLLASSIYIVSLIFMIYIVQYFIAKYFRKPKVT